MKLITYLCGPINGKTDDECSGWREYAKRRLITETLDPMRNDYRGKEKDHYKEIVDNDIQDISDVDFILVNACEPSWGTVMEIVYAHLMNKCIVAFVGNISNISPWLRYHCSEIVSNIDIAITLINSRVGSHKESL